MIPAWATAHETDIARWAGRLLAAPAHGRWLDRDGNAAAWYATDSAYKAWEDGRQVDIAAVHAAAVHLARCLIGAV